MSTIEDMERQLAGDEALQDAAQAHRWASAPVAAVVRVDGPQTSVCLRDGLGGAEVEAQLETRWRQTYEEQRGAP